jgi:hypothetical protein
MEDDILEGAVATQGRMHRLVPETPGRPRHDGVLRGLRERGFQIDSDAFGQDTGFVAPSRYGVAVLHEGRSA